MPTEGADEQAVARLQVRRLARQLESLGGRIALLAQSLDLPLQTAAETQAVLQCDQLCATRAGTGGREARMREELRGLLVLRYEVVTQLARNERIGAPGARDLLLYANECLLAKGFDARAPGMNLRPLFDGIDA